jgi:HipA-like C-terminal domain
MAVDDNIIALMHRRQGAATSEEIQGALKLSQPTVSRALSAMIRGGQLMAVGQARRRIYLLAQPIAGVATPIAMMRVDAHGAVTPFGRLTPLVGGRYSVEFADRRHQIFGGLPWFLCDMRPQGFLGRLFSRIHPHLNLDANPLRWTDADVLRALVAEGDDLPGNLLIGDIAFERFQNQRVSPNATVREADYPAIAQRVMAGAAAGSSAGGEQPKFCATRHDGVAVIVKFSPLDESAAATRWRDLLICEHHALSTLRAHGHPASVTKLLIADRVYLEVERFDRTVDNQGRIGLVSLEAFDGEYIGQMDSWDKTAQRAESRGLMLPADARRLRCWEAFGHLIANTDRHYGNISLLRQDEQWRLAPAYDMLPMFYAPVSGEVVDRAYAPRTVMPTIDTLDVWDEAVTLANAFWQTVRKDQRISAGFQARIASDWGDWMMARG